MNSNKNTIWAIFGLFAIAILVYGVWSAVTKPTSSQTGNPEGVVCTTDARQCPDGSWVGRSGPNCQFVCPVGTTTTPTTNSVFLETMIGKKSSGLNVSITPLLVVEDSRCPINVQCIQAGTVRVRAILTSGLGTSEQVFTLNTPITTEAEIVTLFSVTPAKEAEKNIGAADYRFVFKVAKR